MRILGRPPDAGGLESYNKAMNFGLTEEQMRASLLRSNEYARKNRNLLMLVEYDRIRLLRCIRALLRDQGTNKILVY